MSKILKIIGRIARERHLTLKGNSAPKGNICHEKHLCLSSCCVAPAITPTLLNNSKVKLGQLEPKFKIEYTCKVCLTRNSNIISKVSYTKGVIIVQCTGCKNNHLIADNLNWFPDAKDKINLVPK